MRFPFNLLRIKGLYAFRTLLAHPQEAQNKRHLVYCVRIMWVGCGTVAVSCRMKSESRWFHYTDIPWRTVSHYTDIPWCTVSHYTDIPWCTVRKKIIFDISLVFVGQYVHASRKHFYSVLALAYPEGCLGGSNPPPPPKLFRSFDKAEPNFQFRGK
jgi:hypothetical protein